LGASCRLDFPPGTSQSPTSMAVFGSGRSAHPFLRGSGGGFFRGRVRMFREFSPLLLRPSPATSLFRDQTLSSCPSPFSLSGNSENSKRFLCFIILRTYVNIPVPNSLLIKTSLFFTNLGAVLLTPDPNSPTKSRREAVTPPATPFPSKNGQCCFLPPPQTSFPRPRTETRCSVLSQTVRCTNLFLLVMVFVPPHFALDSDIFCSTATPLLIYFPADVAFSLLGCFHFPPPPSTGDHLSSFLSYLVFI